MAKDLNKAMFTGRLGQDVEVKSTSDGTLIANFSVASNRSVKVGDNWKDETEWFRVVAWRNLAETASKLTKGTRVLIEGRIQTREYTDKNNQKQRITEIVASDIIRLDSASGDGGGRAKAAVSDFEDVEADDIPF